MRPWVIIYVTIALNASLFAANLAVAVASGSRTVLAEAIYAITDLVGSGLLLWGLYLSRRPPNVEHPFGFGKERFFWAFVSTVVTFSTAGIVAIVTGLGQLFAPVPVSHLPDGLAVVAATLGVSLVGIWVTLRELRISRETLVTLLESAHQGLKSIFFQDLVTVLGAGVALGGLVVVWRTSNYAIDGGVAAFEGLLLVATGFVLTAESREYLIGRALAPATAQKLLAVVERDANVARVRSFESMLLGPDDALLALKINFQDGLTTDQIEAAIDRLALALRAAYPVLHHVVIEPES
jgi:cation diffusion facilitator family transporter